MELIDLGLFAAALLCTLVAGFLVAFALVVMPGIAGLSDMDFLKAFKGIDRVIQNNQPLFVFIWIGSALAAIASAAVSIWQLAGSDRILVISAAVIYIFGVQLPTVAVNVPLNNRLQESDLDRLSESEIGEARKGFEGPWLRWNLVRTCLAVLTSSILIIVCLRV